MVHWLLFVYAQSFQRLRHLRGTQGIDKAAPDAADIYDARQPAPAHGASNNGCQKLSLPDTFTAAYLTSMGVFIDVIKCLWAEIVKLLR